MRLPGLILEKGDSAMFVLSDEFETLGSTFSPNWTCTRLLVSPLFDVFLIPKIVWTFWPRTLRLTPVTKSHIKYQNIEYR